jgi:hypothetical protein
MVVSSCSSFEERRVLNSRQVSLADKFTAQIPEFFSINQVSTIEDFLLYNIKDADGHQVMSIYFGNQPDTRIDKGGIATSICGFSAFMRKIEDKNGMRQGEFLINLDNDSGWPMYAHVQYELPSASLETHAIDITRSICKEKNIN